jgi:ATP-binding cassette subfamily B multidrug efflux pump
MEPFHEDEASGAKLYNRELMRTLFGYALAYKKQLFFSLFCVVVITFATLAIPFISKTIIDRHIVKQGYIVDERRLSPQSDAELAKRLKKAIRLDAGHSFALQSQLSFFSKSQVKKIVANGVFSAEKYTVVELPTLTDALAAKCAALASRGDLVEYPGPVYCVRPKALSAFTARERLLLFRADVAMVTRYVLLMIAVFCIQFAASYLQIVSLMKLSQHSMRDLRRDLFGRIMSLEVSYFDRNPIGKLVNRVTNDIEVLNEMFSSVLVTLFQDILIIVGITAVMFSVHAPLACAVAVTFPFLFAVTFLFRVKARGAYRVIRTKIADLNAFINENISGVRIVQLFVQEAKQKGKFRRINNEVYAANMRQLYVYAVFRPLIDFFRWFAVAAVIYLGANLIIDGMISYGLVLMFLSYIASFFEPIGDLSEKFDIMQSATAAGEKILEVFNAPAQRELDGSSVIGAPTANAGPRLPFVPGAASALPKGEIVFDNVWFGYNPDSWVLRGVSFSVRPRETCAIVGETGSGKSTIIHLLSRLYTVQKGAIFIDGVNIQDISYGALRAAIATVAQEVFLFSRTVRENVTLNRVYQAEKFQYAARITHIDRFICGLKNGENEKVMERGATFSAGERQLLSFARALYADPSILVLDEATSNIDTETERLIQDAIAHLIVGRTSIIVAHRLSTIQNAQKILVLDKGVIAENGGHLELCAKKGLYYNLYKLQFGEV